MTPGNFPPHWFIATRHGASVNFSITPVNGVVHHHQIAYFFGTMAKDSHHETKEALDTILRYVLPTTPEQVPIIITCLFTLGDCIQLLSIANGVMLDAKNDLETLFPPAPLFAVPPFPPSDPLPEGHADSYSMERLKADIDQMEINWDGGKL